MVERPAHGAAVRIAARLLVVLSLLLTLTSVVGYAARGSFSDPYAALAVALNAGVAIAHLAIGLLLIERGRGGAIGPLLLVAGAVVAAFGWFDLYLAALRDGALPQSLAGADLAGLFWAANGYPFSAAVTAAMLLFPNGRLPSRRWRWAMALGVAGTVGGLVAFVFGSMGFGPVYPMLRSPFMVRGFSGVELEVVSSIAIQAFRVLAVASLILRWRRGDRILRAQTTWVLAVLAAMAVAQFAVFVTRGVWDWTSFWVSIALTTTVLGLPIAMGVAIVRFHLFEIDRLVSRTIAYAAITAILGLVFVAASLTFAAIGGSLGLATVFGGIQMGETLSVSMATLLVASLFGRVRRRVQRSVDRRFDRVRYDGANTIAGLSQRLRDDVDLDSVRDDVLGVVDTTLHPAQRTMWLRPPHEARRTTP